MARENRPAPVGSQKQSAAPLIWAAMLVAVGWRDAAARLSACLAEPVTWVDVRAEARRLRAEPLVYAGLLAAAANVPTTVLDSLRRATLAWGARAARLEEAAATVLTLASEARIGVLVLKGLALQNLAYPRGLVRPMDDIDLLVSRDDAPRLADLLRRQGYRNDLRGEEDFFATDFSHSIDVHLGLLNTTRVPARSDLWSETFQDIWQRRQPVAMGAFPAWTLGPQDCLQHFALHSVHHHGLQGALWMADLSAMLRAWPEAVAALCGAPAGVRRSVWYCLEVFAARGHDPTPEGRAMLRPHQLFPGERRLLAQVTSATASRSRVSPGGRRGPNSHGSSSFLPWRDTKRDSPMRGNRHATHGSRTGEASSVSRSDVGLCGDADPTKHAKNTQILDRTKTVL